MSTGPARATAPAAAVNVGVVPGTEAGAPPAIGPDAVTVVAITPERIVVPRLGVDAPVVAVHVAADGTLDVPDDPGVIGWWVDGALPGAARGTAIVAGHVNTATAGPGVFARLGELQPGDEIILVGAGQEVRFRMEALRSYPKSDLPAEEAFSQDVTGRLALVTCGGPFNPNSGHYPDNLIAYSVPA